MFKKVAIFRGGDWFLASFHEVKSGDKIVILDPDCVKTAAKDAYRNHRDQWTVAIVTSTNEETA